MNPRLYFIASHIALILFGFGVSPACSEVTNLVCEADTGLFENNPDNNLGGMDFMPAGTTSGIKRSRALLKFNVAEAIPPGAVASSVTLTLHVSVAQGFGRSYNLHRVLQPWTEGGGNGGGGHSGGLGALAAAGEVTWNNRSHPGIPWGIPGAADGADVVTNIISASAIMAASSLAFESAGLVEDVNLWINSPGTNFGWLLKMADESTATTASRITTREDAVNPPPVLAIEYTPPSALPDPPNIFGVAKVGNDLRFSFNGQSGKSYTVDSRLGLGAGWLLLTNLPALSANSVVHITNTIAGDEKYYRVRTP